MKLFVYIIVFTILFSFFSESYASQRPAQNRIRNRHNSNAKNQRKPTPPQPNRQTPPGSTPNANPSSSTDSSSKSSRPGNPNQGGRSQTNHQYDDSVVNRPRTGDLPPTDTSYHDTNTANAIPATPSKDTKLSVDTIVSGAFSHNEKNADKAQLWSEQSSVAQAIGVDMISTIVVPMSMYIMPVGYQGEGHLGLTIPEPVWKHWAAGSSISRYEKLSHGPKMPIYNSHSGNNAMLTDSDRLVDHGFFADVIYDFQIDILPCLKEITDTILYVYRTLHRFETAQKHATLIAGRESSPHMYMEPQLLTHLLQTLYTSASEFIHNLSSSYTLTIMNPKRNWIIESLTLNDQLDKVLYDLLKSAEKNAVNQQVPKTATEQNTPNTPNPPPPKTEPDTNRLHQQQFSAPPFHGFRPGLSLTEMFAAHQYGLGEWSSDILQLINDEVQRIDKRLDIEGQHIQSEKADTKSPWQSMSLFDYLDEKIMLYAAKRDAGGEHEDDTGKKASGQKRNAIDVESIFGRNIKQSSTAWLDRLEEALLYIAASTDTEDALSKHTEVIPKRETPAQAETKTKTNNQNNSPNDFHGHRRNDHLDPMFKRNHRKDPHGLGKPQQATIPEISPNRRSHDKSTIKLVSSLTVAHQAEQSKLNQGLKRNQNVSNAMVQGTFTQLSVQQHQQYKDLLAKWATRVRSVFRQFGEYLSRFNKQQDTLIKSQKEGNEHSEDMWLQGLTPDQHFSFISHLFPTQLAMQSYLSSNELGLANAKIKGPADWNTNSFRQLTGQLPPLSHQSCLTETFIGSNRTAIIDLTAGPFSWGGGRGHSGDYGIGYNLDSAGSRTSTKIPNALPNADHLSNIKTLPGQTQYVTTNRDDLVLKYYDIRGIRGVKFDYDSVLRSEPQTATTPTAQPPTTPDQSSPINTAPQVIKVAQYNLARELDQDVQIEHVDNELNHQMDQADSPLSLHTLSVDKSDLTNFNDTDIDVDAVEYDIELDHDVDSELDVIKFHTLAEIDEYLLDLPQSSLINDDADSDDMFDVHAQFIPESNDAAVNSEDDRFNNEIIEEGQKRQNFLLQQNPFLRNRRRAAVRPTQPNQQQQQQHDPNSTDPAANGTGSGGTHRGAVNLSDKPNAADVDSPYAKSTASSHHNQGPSSSGDPQEPAVRTKSQLFQEALDELLKSGKFGTTDEVNVDQHDPLSGQPPPLIRKKGIQPGQEFATTDSIEEMLRRAGFNKDALGSMGRMPDSMPKDAAKDTTKHTKAEQATFDHDVVTHIMDTIKRDEQEHAEQKATIGDDTKLDESTIVNEKTIQDILDKAKHQFDHIGQNKRMDRMNRNKNPTTSSKSVPPNTKHTAEQLENEMLMLEQLLQSDMCVQNLLDCTKYRSDYETLQRVYRREIINNQRFDPERATGTKNDDGTVDYDKDTTPSSTFTGEYLDTEVPLTLQDGLQDVELDDLNLKGNKGDIQHENSDAIDYDVFDDLLGQIRQGGDKHREEAAKLNEAPGPKDIIDQTDVDVNLGTTTDAALGANTLNTYDRLQSVADAMPSVDGKSAEQIQRALNFGGHETINGGFSLSSIDYYMSHVNSAINNYINTAILQPMELAGVDKLYYRRVHFTLFLLVDHDDFNPLDLYNIPFVDLKAPSGNNQEQENNQHLDGYLFGPNWRGFPYPQTEAEKVAKEQQANEKKQKAQQEQKRNNRNNRNRYRNEEQGPPEEPTPHPTMSKYMSDFNINMWQLLQLAIEQVRIRGQQFSYNVVPINIHDDIQVYTTLEQSLTTTVTPSYYSNQLFPQSFTHTYINTDILVKQLITSLVSQQAQPLPRNTRHIPIVMLSLATRSQPVLLDVYHQAVVKDGIVIAIQTPHSPSTTAVIVNNFGASQSPLTNIFTPHTPHCNEGYKMYMDPRDPSSAMFYSTLSLLFSTHPPSYGLFVYPHNSPLSLSLPRTTIDAYQRNYLLTALRTTTKIANLATYTLSLLNSDLTNACILEEVYTSADGTYRHPFISEWKDKKLYKLVRKAQRSVRYHLFIMREYMTNLDMENGVKYIRTLVGSAWQYRHLVDTLLTRMDTCSYYSAYQRRKDQGIDLTDMDTYGVYFNPAAIANSVASLIGYDDLFEDENKHRPLSPKQTRSSWSVINSQNSQGYRGLGMYLWLVAVCIIIGLFLFRAVNDVVVTVQSKKDD